MHETQELLREGQADLFRRVNDIDKRLARIEGQLTIALSGVQDDAA